MSPTPHHPRRHGACSREGGFTLMELAFVVVVLGVLSWIALANVGGIVKKGDEIDCHDELRRIKVAVANYQAVVEKLPASTEVLTTTKDPVRGGTYLVDTPSYYEVTADGAVARLGSAPKSCPSGS